MKELSPSRIFNLPIKAIGIALLVSTLIVVFCLIQYLYLEKRNSELQSRHLSLSLNVGRIMLLDEVLTMSARMAAATGDMKYEDRYNQFEPELDILINDTLKLFKGKQTDVYVKQTNRANMELVQMERNAFSLIREGRRDDASFLLNSPAYLRQKVIYSGGMRQTLSILETESELLLYREKVYRIIFYAFSIIGIAIIFAVWLSSIRAMRRWIAGRMETESNLRESEERYRDLFENANDLIQSVDENGGFIYVNRKWKNVLGYTDEEIKNLTLVDILRKDTIPHCMEIFRELQKGKEIENIEAVFVTKCGDEVFVEGKVGAKMQDGKFISTKGIFRDVTDRKRLETQLLHAKKMEAIGQLAGGVAHGFNNILTSVIGYADLLGMKLHSGDSLKGYVDHIIQSSERAAGLARDLLTYSRKQSVNLRIQDINEIIKASEVFLSRVISEGINLRLILSDDKMPVMADRNQMEQVLRNLVTNSTEAMPHGGFIIIRTSRYYIDDTFIKDKGFGKTGEYILVTVSDTGSGMDEKIKEKIFEPFFSTKEFGMGTGLGLSIVYGIIKQMKGYIDVESENSKGTTFSLYLPLAEIRHDNELSSLDKIPAGGNETILIAEDEGLVRRFMKTVFEEFGYKVIEATDGEEAVKRFENNKDNIDLALLDVVLPFKTGAEVYQEIFKGKPDMKFIFISGYPKGFMNNEAFYNKTGIEFIMKPVSTKELLSKVRSVLDKDNKTPHEMIPT
ncbi:MAG: PAS domain S-box protein [Nitrospirae bacterium]|nr:PAS domain S-box protein [Nitrospirota bacterium]